MKIIRSCVFGISFFTVCFFCFNIVVAENPIKKEGRAFFVFVCSPTNDIFREFSKSDGKFLRFDSAAEAVDAAPLGSAVLILADKYPEQTINVPQNIFQQSAKKKVRLYIEFPAWLPGLVSKVPVETELERGVITSDLFGGNLPPMSILYLHGCRYIPYEAQHPHIVIAKVAGFDKAVYGLENTDSYPVLFEHPDYPALISTTKLSQCITGRFAPAEDWQLIWNRIFVWLQPEKNIPDVNLTPSVRTSYGKMEIIPGNAESRSLRKGIDWFFNARLLIHHDWEETYLTTARSWSDRVGQMPDLSWPVGDGSLGVLEGFSSRVDNLGYQKVRWWRRNDCNAEIAGAMALAGKASGNGLYSETAANICNWLCFESVMSQGDRADSTNPSYGLFGWNDVEKYYENLNGYGVYYGDDNARSLLGIISAASILETGRWDETVIRCILANFRTTGPLGFRQNRIDESLLIEKGWKHFFNTEITSYSPHFQAYLWACYLWAYAHTGYDPFLERSKKAIGMMMDAYPDDWHWTNGIQQERARMLLPLAWLVRVENTPEHRQWLKKMAGEMLNSQNICGAIREEIGPGKGKYGPPASNAEYGTNEASLIHVNGDPVSDLLYTTNFAFLGLHEAAAATGDIYYREAEDKLAAFLCRIQVQSDSHPELDGAWFRAFDYNRWEHWASNSDAGWGAWSTETGWTQGWITSVLALRLMDTSLWDISEDSSAGQYFEGNLKIMIPGFGE